MNTIMLNNNWKVLEAPMRWDKSYAAVVSDKKEGWMSCDLPADVRMPLLEAGKIKEPLQSDNCRESEWIENRSWWFEKRFSGSEVDLNMDIIELVLEGLDTRSDIFINGHYLGTYRSVHYPFIHDVKNYLRQDENSILVRVTSGLEEVSDEDLAEIDHAVCLESHNGGKYRGDARRAFVRRPQYTVGWDWGPKVITIGITGNVFLRGYKTIAIREAELVTEEIHAGAEKKDAIVKVMVNVENLDFLGSATGNIRIQVGLEGKIVAQKEVKDQLFTSGYNYIETEIKVPDAHLWWPNGYGKQPLYDVNISAECKGVRQKWPEIHYGIRTLTLDTSLIKGEKRKFNFIVNGTEIYCKGGNWIPNDFIYARVPEEKYQVLIAEAKEANFNMIRVWGGGLYEREVFYELCDKNGILLWHDLMFACASYPDHLEWFQDEMRKEYDYQTKRLRNHCCMGVICGTNEVHWIFNHVDNPNRWELERTYERQYGLWCANILAKEIIRKNCAHIPYWNSSPYGGNMPNSDDVGDVHRWHNAFMSKKMEQRIEPKDFDTVESCFVSEYGFVGPCCLESTKEYMGDAPLDRESEIWHMHSNVFEKGTVNVVIEKNYKDHPEQLSMEDYILYGGMVHGLMYGYSLEAMRFKKSCSGGLFWMYNDAWGEVGWTIIDYYLRRKIPFYAVKRALAPVKLTMRLVDGKVVLQGCNDTDRPVEVKGRFGYVSYDGKLDHTREIQLVLPPASREYYLEEKPEKADYQKGTYMFYCDNGKADNISLRLYDNRELQYEGSEVAVLKTEEYGDDKLVTVSAKGFVHGVYVKDNWDCDDNYFDLLPGEEKTICVKGAAGKEIEIGAVR